MRQYYLLLPAAVLVAPPAHATTYFTVDQVQAALFPGEVLRPVPHTLTDDQVAAVRRASGVSPLSRAVKAWRAAGGGWLVVDEVVGKHDFITYAVALDAGGAVKGVEIMDYRETYGGQVREPRWRAQFTGKRADNAPQLGKDIRNISGATLSSKHVTDGIRRVLATYAIVLAHG